MTDNNHQRGASYFLAQAVGELRLELEKLKRGRQRDREDIATLVRQNRSLRSTITRLEKRLTQDAPKKTVRRTRAPAMMEPSLPSTAETEYGSGGMPDFSEPMSELQSMPRAYS